MFEQASKQKIRWEYKGSLSSEELWDLDENNLVILFNKIDDELSTMSGRTAYEKLGIGSVKPTTAKTKHQLRLDIVGHILKTKVTQRKEKEQALLTSQKKQKLMELIEQKRDATLASQPIEELEKMLNEL